MREDTKELFEKYIRDCLDYVKSNPGEGYCVGIGVSDDMIISMEDEIGLKFSDDYIEFLRHYGEANLYGLFEIYGYAANSMYGKIGRVVEQTKFYRELGRPGVEDGYIISEDLCGNPIGCKSDGSVWVYPHDAGSKFEKIADSFDDFLCRILTGAIYTNSEQAHASMRMNKKDEDVIIQVILDFLCSLEFSESIDKDGVVDLQECIGVDLENLSPECQKYLAQTALCHAEKYSGAKKRYLENYAYHAGFIPYF